MDKKTFSFVNQNSLKPSQASTRSHSLNGLWFRKVFLLSFSLCGFFLLMGNLYFFILSKKENQEKQPKVLVKNEPGDIVFPSFPVNLKTPGGVVPALVEVHLKTDKLPVKKEILVKSQKFQKYLLLLLSGQNKGDLQNNKSDFEEKIRSQFNVFLSQGAVQQVKIHTRLIN